jgi:hypothetical protein
MLHVVVFDLLRFSSASFPAHACGFIVGSERFSSGLVLPELLSWPVSDPARVLVSIGDSASHRGLLSLVPIVDKALASSGLALWWLVPIGDSARASSGLAPGPLGGREGDWEAQSGEIQDVVVQAAVQKKAWCRAWCRPLSFRSVEKTLNT